MKYSLLQGSLSAKRRRFWLEIDWNPWRFAQYTPSSQIINELWVKFLKCKLDNTHNKISFLFHHALYFWVRAALAPCLPFSCYFSRESVFPSGCRFHPWANRYFHPSRSVTCQWTSTAHLWCPRRCWSSVCPSFMCVVWSFKQARFEGQHYFVSCSYGGLTSFILVSPLDQ